MARFSTVSLFLACLFMLASQTVLADTKFDKRLPISVFTSGLDPPVAASDGLASSSTSDSATESVVPLSTSSTNPIIIPSDTRTTSSIIPTTSTPSTQSAQPTTTSTSSSSSVASSITTSSRPFSWSMSNSTSSVPSKTNTNSYSFNPTSFIFNSTINGHIVTITSTTAAPPIPTATYQGEHGHVNTQNVIIVISAIGGTVLFSTVAFAWIKLYKGRRAGWDDDELMNIGYGDNSEDPFKSTLNQYHRS